MGIRAILKVGTRLRDRDGREMEIAEIELVPGLLTGTWTPVLILIQHNGDCCSPTTVDLGSFLRECERTQAEIVKSAGAQCQ